MKNEKHRYRPKKILSVELQLYHNFYFLFYWAKMGLDQSLENYVRFSMLVKVNSLPSARFRAFLEKRTPEHTWLCAGISLVWYALQTW